LKKYINTKIRIIIVFLLLGFQVISCAYKTSNEKTITHSLYIFHFNSGQVKIKDDYNKIINIYGGKPNKIEVVNGIKITHFYKCVIMKTKCDSIEPSEKYVRLKGYMGIISNNNSFTVDEEGIISDDSWHGG
jgi:hypothetical protein